MEEGIRIFEVLSSHYLELNSDQGLKETDKAIAEEFELDRERWVEGGRSGRGCVGDCLCVYM